MTGEAKSCPKSYEGRNQQPEQSFHEEEKKTPKTETLDPLGYGMCRLYCALQEIRKR
jgi:hypothetical protein